MSPKNPAYKVLKAAKSFMSLRKQVSGLEHSRFGRPGSSEHSSDVPEDLSRLGIDFCANYLQGCRVERDAARCIDECIDELCGRLVAGHEARWWGTDAVVLDGLDVGANGGGGSWCISLACM